MSRTFWPGAMFQKRLLIQLFDRLEPTAAWKSL
jgi:hypothetical protein